MPQVVHVAAPPAPGPITSRHTSNVRKENMSAGIDTFLQKSFAEGEPTLERPQGDTAPGQSHDFWETAGQFATDISPLVNAFTGRNTAASQPAKAAQAPTSLAGLGGSNLLLIGGAVLAVVVLLLFLKRK